jgi:hypothetical protein
MTTRTKIRAFNFPTLYHLCLLGHISKLLIRFTAVICDLARIRKNSSFEDKMDLPRGGYSHVSVTARESVALGASQSPLQKLNPCIVGLFASSSNFHTCFC